MGDDESHSEYNLNSIISAPIRIFNGITETLFGEQYNKGGGRDEDEGRQVQHLEFRLTEFN